MNIIIGILVCIGFMCILCTIVFMILLALNWLPIDDEKESKSELDKMIESENQTTIF